MKKYTFITILASALSISAHPTGEVNHHHKDTQIADKVAKQDTILGHNGLRYTVDLNWAKAQPEIAPVINSHALAESRDGLIYLVTDHPKNAFLVFKKDGTFVRSFGGSYNGGAKLIGGHSLEFFERDGQEYLIHVDAGWHSTDNGVGWKFKAGTGRITILKTDGTIVKKLPTPVELNIAKKFMPCDVAVTPEGNILIADGYATNIIYEMTMEGKLVRQWGGDKLSNAHGISLDLSDPKKPLAWVSSRNENKIKAFTLEGEHVDTIELPGAYAGQLVFQGDKIYTAVCWSKENGTGKKLPNSGFLLILDRKTKQVISAPGGSEPVYKDGKLEPMKQMTKTFIHGHDLCVDKDGAIYFGEWNAKRRYPAKLTPVK